MTLSMVILSGLIVSGVSVLFCLPSLLPRSAEIIISPEPKKKTRKPQRIQQEARKPVKRKVPTSQDSFDKELEKMCSICDREYGLDKGETLAAVEREELRAMKLSEEELYLEVASVARRISEREEHAPDLL